MSASPSLPRSLGDSRAPHPTFAARLPLRRSPELGNSCFPVFPLPGKLLHTWGLLSQEWASEVLWAAGEFQGRQSEDVIPNTVSCHSPWEW